LEELEQGLAFHETGSQTQYKANQVCQQKKAYSSNRSIPPEASSDPQEASSESIDILKWLTAPNQVVWIDRSIHPSIQVLRYAEAQLLRTNPPRYRYFLELP